MRSITSVQRALLTVVILSTANLVVSEELIGTCKSCRISFVWPFATLTRQAPVVRQHQQAKEKDV
jgi:hypothetical protein